MQHIWRKSLHERLDFLCYVKILHIGKKQTKIPQSHETAVVLQTQPHYSIASTEIFHNGLKEGGTSSEELTS